MIGIRGSGNLCVTLILRVMKNAWINNFYIISRYFSLFHHICITCLLILGDQATLSSAAYCSAGAISLYISVLYTS